MGADPAPHAPATALMSLHLQLSFSPVAVPAPLALPLASTVPELCRKAANTACAADTLRPCSRRRPWRQLWQQWRKHWR